MGAYPGICGRPVCQDCETSEDMQCIACCQPYLLQVFDALECTCDLLQVFDALECTCGVAKGKSFTNTALNPFTGDRLCW